MLISHTGILLLCLERRGLGLLRRDLPHAHQRTRSLHLHRHAMAFPVRHSPRFAHYADRVERRVLLLLRELLGDYGVWSVLVGAGDEGKDSREDG